MSVRAKHLWRAGFLAVLLAGILPAPGLAQPAPDTGAALADTLPPDHPNRVPYRSERSVAEHVLAAPAYALHLATRPLAWAVREAEERVPQVFEGKLPSYGAYPIFETGGRRGLPAGQCCSTMTCPGADTMPRCARSSGRARTTASRRSTRCRKSPAP